MASTGEEGSAEAFFVVRPASAASAAAAILVLATNTYNAYNQWGGACLYSDAVKVSFDRPLERGYLRRPAAPDEVAYDGRMASLPDEPDEQHLQLQGYLADFDYPLWCASSGWHNWERRFVRWAEAEGIALDYAVNSDLEFHPEVLDGHRLMLSVGHDEYWSWAMRDRVDAFVEAGGSWAIFSGNTCFWQVRFEDDGRTMVCYKGRATKDDPVAGTDARHLLTSMWPLPAIGRPEAESIGLSFTRGGYARVGQATPRSSGGYTVHRPEHPIFAGTDLRYGDVLGGPSRIVGYEVDGCELTIVNGDPVPTYQDSTPAGLEVLATAPARLLSITPTSSEVPEALWASTDPPGDLEGVAAALFGSASPENVAAHRPQPRRDRDVPEGPGPGVQRGDDRLGVRTRPRPARPARHRQHRALARRDRLTSAALQAPGDGVLRVVDHRVARHGRALRLEVGQPGRRPSASGRRSRIAASRRRSDASIGIARSAAATRRAPRSTAASSCSPRWANTPAT